MFIINKSFLTQFHGNIKYHDRYLGKITIHIKDNISDESFDLLKIGKFNSNIQYLGTVK